MVESEGDEGPWVFAIPPAFVDAVAKLTPAEAKKVATEWAKAEEFVKDGFTPARVAKSLTAIVGLCQTTKQKKLSMFLWMCL